MGKRVVYVRPSTIKKIIVNKTTEIKVKLLPAIPVKKNFWGKIINEAYPARYEYGWVSSTTPNELVEKHKEYGEFIKFDEAENKFYLLPNVFVMFDEKDYEKTAFETDEEALNFALKIATENNLICITN